jgi:hypothetical protein
MQFVEIGKQVLDVVQGEGAVDVAGHLGLLPAGQVVKDLLTLGLYTALQCIDLGRHSPAPRERSSSIFFSSSAIGFSNSM